MKALYAVVVAIVVIVAVTLAITAGVRSGHITEPVVVDVVEGAIIAIGGKAIKRLRGTPRRVSPLAERAQLERENASRKYIKRKRESGRELTREELRDVADAAFDLACVFRNGKVAQCVLCNQINNRPRSCTDDAAPLLPSGAIAGVACTDEARKQYGPNCGTDRRRKRRK